MSKCTRTHPGRRQASQLRYPSSILSTLWPLLIPPLVCWSSWAGTKALLSVVSVAGISGSRRRSGASRISTAYFPACHLVNLLEATRFFVSVLKIAWVEYGSLFADHTDWDPNSTW